MARKIALFLVSLLTCGWPASSPTLFGSHLLSSAQAQTPSKAQLRAQVKRAAEELNEIASSAPGLIKSMFAGDTPSAKLLALDERAIAAQSQLEKAILSANEKGALTENETKELARLGDLAKQTRGPVQEDIDTLKTVLAVPVVGGDTAVRLATKSQQEAVIKNAEAAKQAVGALVTAIRAMP